MSRTSNQTGWRVGAAAIAVLLALGLPPNEVAAQPAPSAAAPMIVEAPPFSFTHDFDYAIGNDGLLTLTARYRGKVMNASGVQALGTYRDTNNANFFTYDVLEAATVKPDGRRVPVDPAKMLVQAAPASPDALHFYLDHKTHTLIFPELAPGDEVEALIRIKQTAFVTPGGVSRSFAFSRSVRRAGATVTIRAPKHAELQVWQAGLDHRREETDSEVVHRLIYAGQPYAVAEPGAVDAFDYEPRFAFSTFRDWQGIARAFWDRGADKAEPTPAIAAKAREIAGDAPTEREKAERVFLWVSRNIRYVNIVLGAGGWVPRQAESVLANLYGDCKDHVTLMRAMLKVFGIEADYALVNVASRYRPYAIPVADFDHIILYLPGLGIYLDPTNRFGQFGAIDARLQGKPALRFNASRAEFTQMPVAGPEQNAVIYRAELAVGENGQLSGETSLAGHGSAASFLRQRAVLFANEGLATSATRLLQSQNWRGTARFDVAGADGNAHPAIIRASFELRANAFEVEGDGLRLPLGPMPSARPHLGQLRYLRENYRTPISCLPFRHEEHVTIRLPPGASLRKLPAPLAIRSGALSYSADYAVSGGTFKASRIMVRTGEGVVCDQATFLAERATVNAIARDHNRARFGLELAGRDRNRAGEAPNDEPE